MTRHEAKTILQVSGFDEYSADLWLKRYVALGMLKLDEPKKSAKCTEEMALPVIAKALGRYTSPERIIGALLIAGFRIVEK